VDYNSCGRKKKKQKRKGDGEKKTTSRLIGFTNKEKKGEGPGIRVDGRVLRGRTSTKVTKGMEEGE